MFRLSTNNIEFNRVAKIVSGEDEGKFVKFIYEPQTGYFIYQATTEKFNQDPVFDTWYEKIEYLVEAVTDDGWLLEWVED